LHLTQVRPLKCSSVQVQQIIKLPRWYDLF